MYLVILSQKEKGCGEATAQSQNSIAIVLLSSKTMSRAEVPVT